VLNKKRGEKNNSADFIRGIFCSKKMAILIGLFLFATKKTLLFFLIWRQKIRKIL